MNEHVAWKFGDDVDTDAIIPGRFLANWNSCPEQLRTSCFLDIRPEFSCNVAPGDLVVGGENFGCGSSREAAPVSLKISGIVAVIAASFGRIFYRNCLNIGLPAIIAPQAARETQQGDLLHVDMPTCRIINHTRHTEYVFIPFPPFIREMLASGGLGAVVQRRMAERRTHSLI